MKSVSTITKRLIYYSLIILALAAAGVGSASAILFRGAEIYPSVFIGEIDVGRLTKDDAALKVNEYFNARKGTPLVILSVEGQLWPIYAADIDAQYFAPDMIDKAFLVAREGHPLQRIRERYLVMQQKKTIPFQINYDLEKLSALIRKISDHYHQPPINASMQRINGHFATRDHQLGRNLPADSVVHALNDAIRQEWGSTVALNVEITIPHILTDDITMIAKEWTSYNTEFNNKDLNRTENITIAASSVNGTILKPGDVFSFNNIVGLRSKDKGYKDAPAYIQGKLVMDVGGGVCQVTSTLYNSTLLANLEIIERSSHFRPPGYVPIGMDATVADNALDFSFKNNSASAIYIECEVYGNQLGVRIFGADIKQRPDVQILTTGQEIFDAKTIIKQDAELPLGQQVIEQEEQKGYKVTTIRVVSQDNRELRREVLSQDEFVPVDKIIRVGTKIASTKPGIQSK